MSLPRSHFFAAGADQCRSMSSRSSAASNAGLPPRRSITSSSSSLDPAARNSSFESAVPSHATICHCAPLRHATPSAANVTSRAPNARQYRPSSLSNVRMICTERSPSVAILPLSPFSSVASRSALDDAPLSDADAVGATTAGATGASCDLDSTSPSTTPMMPAANALMPATHAIRDRAVPLGRSPSNGSFTLRLSRHSDY